MKRLTLLFGMGFLLTACAGPYVDARREAGTAGTVGQSSDTVLAICYNPITHGIEETLTEATHFCAEQNKTPHMIDVKYFNCSLTAPNTAFYTCE